MLSPALLLTAALLTSAPAPSSGVAPAFGNTIVSTYPDGRTAKAWLQRDGTYLGEGRRGGRSSGKWTVKGQQVCFRQSRPIWIPKSYCTPLVAGGVGASWPAKAVTGESITMTLVAGSAGR